MGGVGGVGGVGVVCATLKLIPPPRVNVAVDAFRRHGRVRLPSKSSRNSAKKCDASAQVSARRVRDRDACRRPAGRESDPMLSSWSTWNVLGQTVGVVTVCAEAVVIGAQAIAPTATASARAMRVLPLRGMVGPYRM